jgi:RNA polymerase sigma factor (TIGR02999 family)
VFRDVIVQNWTVGSARGTLVSMSDVTQILSRINQGDRSATEQLLPLVYQELRRLAAARMADERPDHTLSATALVHEAYLRLVGSGRNDGWDSRGHFFVAAAAAMRRILVESARRKQGPTRGGDLQRQDVDLDRLTSPKSSPDLLEIDEALKNLAVTDPDVARLVELRYFAGLTLKEAAVGLGVSDRTAERYWAYAKAWLHQALGDSSDD